MSHRGVRLGTGGRVHRPSTATDHRGDLLPAPACNTGIAGWDARRLRFTEAPVDCLRCLRMAGAAEYVPLQQLAMF